MNNYYVYGLFDKNDECFYIGKGRERRMFNHRKDFKANRITNYFLYCKLKSLQNKNEDFKEKIILNNLSESDALKEEIILIEKYGRKINGGILCNVMEGGNQPPSAEDIKKIYGEEFFKKSKQKQSKTFLKTCYDKGLKYKEKIEQLLSNGLLMKDVALELNLNPNTISKWIKLYNIKYDYTKKRELEKERLRKYREFNSKKVQKTAYTYVVVTPENEEITTNKLVLFCRERKVDYRSLRNTFNKLNKNGTKSKSKGYYIKEMFK